MKIILFISFIIPSEMIMLTSANFTESVFTIYKNTFYSSNKTIITSIENSNTMSCMAICSRTENCYIAVLVIKNGKNKCNIHEPDINLESGKIQITNSTLYKRSINSKFYDTFMCVLNYLNL